MSHNITAKEAMKPGATSGAGLLKWSLLLLLIAGLVGVGILLGFPPAGPRAVADEKQPTVTKKGLELSVAAGKKEFAAGDKLTFIVTVKNISKKPFRLIQIARLTANTFSGRDAEFRAGGRVGEDFKSIGPTIQLSSTRGQGAPPPGRDVPSQELMPGSSTTFDLEFNPRYLQYAKLKTKPLHVMKHLPPGQYRAVFSIHFRHPQVLKEGKFAERPDPSFWAGDMTTPAVKFEIAK